MKKIEIDIEETIRRTNTYTVEVEDNVEKWMVENEIEDAVGDAVHPDDILQAFNDAGYNAELTCHGAEDVSYEVDY